MNTLHKNDALFNTNLSISHDGVVYLMMLDLS